MSGKAVMKKPFVVVLVKGGIPQEAQLKHSWPKARDAAKSFAQAPDFEDQVDVVQVFQGGIKKLTNSLVDEWIAERSSKSSSKK
jgi:hypothetical protein